MISSFSVYIQVIQHTPVVTASWDETYEFPIIKLRDFWRSFLVGVSAWSHWAFPEWVNNQWKFCPSQKQLSELNNKCSKHEFACLDFSCNFFLGEYSTYCPGIIFFYKFHSIDILGKSCPKDHSRCFVGTN